MARSSCQKKSSFSAIEAFAIFLVADAEEENKELIAIAVAIIFVVHKCVPDWWGKLGGKI